ncbi:MAG TPA: hypothetical protein VGM44_13510 [Polyangiaceae bacterium]|jgi:hypothetical protein
MPNVDELLARLRKLEPIELDPELSRSTLERVKMRARPPTQITARAEHGVRHSAGLSWLGAALREHALSLSAHRNSPSQEFFETLLEHARRGE